MEATLALWINDEYVADDVFLAEYRQLGGLQIDLLHPAAELEASRLRRLAEERVLNRTLLRQRAIAHGFSATTEEIEARREEQWGTSSASVCGAGVLSAIGESLLVQKYCDWISRHEPRASRQEVEALYQRRREEFRMGEQVKLMQVIRNIHLPEEEESAWTAMRIAERDLQAGKPFHKVADRYSDCGGKIMLGWVQRGEMVAAFEEIAFGLAKGKRSEVFRTIFGLHILSLVDRKPAGYKSFEDVRPELAHRLLRMRKERRINAELAEAVRCASIVDAPSGTKGLPRKTPAHG